MERNIIKQAFGMETASVGGVCTERKRFRRLLKANWMGFPCRLPVFAQCNACYPYSSGIPECKERESIEKLLHLLPSECDCNWTVATCQARQTWQVQQQQSPHFRLATSLASACSSPVLRLLLCDAVRLPFACVAISFGFVLCNWYSLVLRICLAQCGKFVSFSPRQIG